jgi:hypothetical protein
MADPPEGDIKEQMLELIKQLTPEQLSQVNDSLRDALVSAARGEPCRYAINEMVQIAQDEARRICQKLGLTWQDPP